MNITIDPSLKALIPPLSTEERDLLEQSILEYGCRDPLVVWRHKSREGREDEYTVTVLLDGHNRLEICEEHGIGYEITELEFDNIEQARVWMRDNQMGRRNLSAAWRIELQLANKEDLAKVGAAKKVEAGKEARDKQLGVLSQNDNTPEPKHNTRTEIAKAANTSAGMVGMAEVVRKESPELWEKAKADEVTVSSAYRQLKEHNHRAQGTGQNEWYTPDEYLQAARDVMGAITLDPASSDLAQEKVQAESYFTADDDGLTKDWRGNVWLNPPYAQPLISQFVTKAVDEVCAGRINQAIMLTHNYTDTRWFQAAAFACSAICFTRGRISFLDPEGNKAAPTQGQAFFYFGENTSKFNEEFSKFGFVVEVIRR